MNAKITISIISLLAITACGDNSGSTEKSFENTGNKAWSTPVRISSFPPGSYENDVSLAMDPDGNVMAVWAEYIYTNDHPYGEHQPLSSYFITGQGWSTPETLNDSYSSFVGDLKVQFDANRYAIATWYQVEDESFRGIKASRYVPGEGWGEPVTLYKSPFDTSTNMNPQLAVAPSGDAVVIWGDHQTQSVWTCLYTPGVGWAEPQEMEDTAGKIFLPIEIDVAIDDLGNAIAVWREEDPWRDIMASRYNGTTWSSPIPLEGFQDMDANDPKIGLDASGYGIAIWEGARHIYSARYTPDNHWGQPERLDLGMGHKLAVGSNGDAIAVWRTAVDLRASIFSPDIGWGRPATIHAGDNNVFESAKNPEVAVNDFGDAFVVWMHEGIDNQGIWGKHYNAESGWDEAVEIMKLPISGTPSTPVIVMDNENNAAAAWEEYFGSSRAWVSIYN